MILEILYSSLIKVKNFDAKSFCEKVLIADDPYPFAEFSVSQLLEMYQMTHTREIGKELRFREKAGMLTDEEIEKFNL